MKDGPQVYVSKVLELVKKVSNEETRSCLFEIGDNKAPGIDGYNASFFKKNWSIVGQEIITIIEGFFEKGHYIAEINCATVTLILKVPSPSCVAQF